METGRPRIGVYICHCGINIAANVDVPALCEYAGKLPAVAVARTYLYTCSEPGQAMIRADIEGGLVNRVVVASCSPSMHESTFRALCQEEGLNPYLYLQANIREQCSWVHPAEGATTEKAKDLVRAAVEQVALQEPLVERWVGVERRAAVIGGGVAGLSAALTIAEAGVPVTLIEKASELGGKARHWHLTFPDLVPAETCLMPLVERVLAHPIITVILQGSVESVSGYVGNFSLNVMRKDESPEQIPAGVIVVATGFEPFDPRLKPELAHGISPAVLTTVELEHLLAEAPERFRHAGRIVFVQCVGSRDKRVGNPYCSRVCCMVSTKQASLMKSTFPEAEVSVFYTDVRAFGRGFEEFYDRVRSQGVLFRRGSVSEIVPHGSRLTVCAEDTLLGEPLELEADVAVLAVGMLPSPGNKVLSQQMKLACSSDGFFMERHPKLAPVDTTVDGIYLAGACQSPKDMSEASAHGRAAASSALAPLLEGRVKVEAAVSSVSAELCAACGLCVKSCPYGALAIDPRAGAVRVNPALCKGCGSCSSVCPSSAIFVRHFRPEQVLAFVDGLLFPAN